MSTQLLLIVLVGAMVGAAGVLLVWSMRPQEARSVARPPSTLLPRLRATGSQIPLAVGAGLLILLLTRWPVLAVAAAVLVIFAPTLFGGAGSEKRSIARLEGLAAWTESLRDTIAGAVGLEQAIPATAYAASPAIAGHLTTLADRLRVRTPLPIALQGLADDLDDSSADLILAALILNSRLRGPGLREVLTSLADSAREELEMRRRVSAGRASTRRSVQIVVGDHGDLRSCPGDLQPRLRRALLLAASVRSSSWSSWPSSAPASPGCVACRCSSCRRGSSSVQVQPQEVRLMTLVLLAGALAGRRPVRRRADVRSRNGHRPRPSWPASTPRACATSAPPRSRPTGVTRPSRCAYARSEQRSRRSWKHAGCLCRPVSALTSPSWADRSRHTWA